MYIVYNYHFILIIQKENKLHKQIKISL